jgi:hypothetical protein
VEQIKETSAMAPPLERRLVKHVQNAMVPTPLLGGLGEHGGQGAPDPEMAVADHQFRCWQPAPLEVTQDGRPAVGRFPIAALDGEDHLLAIAQRGQHDEHRGARKIAYGEITVALALSQQLVKRDKTTPQKAVDRVLEVRRSGQGWAATARSLGLKLAHVLRRVDKIDTQVARR